MVVLKLTQEEAKLVLEALSNYNDLGTIDFPCQSLEVETLYKGVQESVAEQVAS